MKYVFQGNSIKEFSNLPKKSQLRVKNKLDFYFATGNPLNFAEHLKNFELGEYRFRVGDYRIIFDIKSDTAVILKIGHRRDIYN